VYPPSARDDDMLALHHGPERMIVPELAAYPAHLHIDVLPDWQGKGLGRELMVAFLAGLAGAGVRAVHLGMLSANVDARAFYDRVGFHEVEVPDAGPLTFLGRATGYSARPRR
jgi:GNAT superfamily N-acetyltransferase